MGSNFGGDGGDVLVDPNDGCNIVQEYVVLSMTVTQTCANPDPATHPNAFLDLSQSTTFKIAPPDVNARFIAPFVAEQRRTSTTGSPAATSVWVQNKGFAIRSRLRVDEGLHARRRRPGRHRGRDERRTRRSAAGAGPCNNNGFTRGMTIGTQRVDGTGWTFSRPPRRPGCRTATSAASRSTPTAAHLRARSTASRRRFTEGPGAGVGHVFKYDRRRPRPGPTSRRTSRTCRPTRSRPCPTAALVVGTDLGVVYRAPGATDVDDGSARTSR